MTILKLNQTTVTLNHTYVVVTLKGKH